MKTRNELQRQYISEAINRCKEAHLPARMWSDYSTAYLSGKLADLSAPPAGGQARQAGRDARPPEAGRAPKGYAHDIALKNWMQEYPEYVFDVMADIDPDRLAELVLKGPEAIGEHVLKRLRESMIDDLESRDLEPDREAEHDTRQRLREAEEEEQEWLGAC